MTLGERIKARREELGISVEEIARMLGKHRATIYRYESSEIGSFPTEALEPLAAVLQTTPAALMGWDTTASTPRGFQPLPRTVKKPLIGRVACGEPILAEESIEDWVDVPENVLCDFCLICAGDSMIDAGINDGDVVYIRAGVDIHNGEIAAVRIEDEATLKRVYIDGDTMTLVAANSRYLPKVYTGAALENVHIEGKAVGFTHLF